VSGAGVEAAYRRWLRWYPRDFRREHADEILSVLLAETAPDCRRPRPIECLDLVRGGVSMRLRPRVPRSDRAGCAAIRLAYLVAVVQCVVMITVVGTTGAMRASILAADPRYTAAQWHAELVSSVVPLLEIAGLALMASVWSAWLSGRGRRWARALVAANFAVTTYSLLRGLAGGSATYARADLASGIVLWLVELAAVVVIVVCEAQRISGSRSGRESGRRMQSCP
jgi:hypothetical protein